MSTEVATNAILSVGGFLYLVLCLPAIGQRGYPPLDPIWDIMPFLWVAPILLSGVFDTRPAKARIWSIAVYAIITAFVDAGTFVVVVPRNVTLLGTLLLTVVPYGPVHLAIAFGLEAIVQLFNRGYCRSVNDGKQVVWRSRRRWAVFGALVIGMVSVPFILRAAAYETIRRRGVARAEDDWSKGKAVVYSPSWTKVLDEQGLLIETGYDMKTGLPLRGSTSHLGFAEAYNGRITQLIAKHGVPEWSMSKFIVTAPDLVALLDSDSFVEIRKFPFDAAEEVLVYRQTATMQPGLTKPNGEGSVWIWTKSSGDIEVGGGAAYVGRIARFPKMIFIRVNKSWIGAFREDGHLMTRAMRFKTQTR